MSRPTRLISTTEPIAPAHAAIVVNMVNFTSHQRWKGGESCQKYLTKRRDNRARSELRQLGERDTVVVFYHIGEGKYHRNKGTEIAGGGVRGERGRAKKGE